MLQYVPGGILDNDLDLIWNDHERKAQPLAMRVVSAGDGQQLLLLHLTLLDGPSDCLRIIEDRDLGYLMWPRIP